MPLREGIGLIPWSPLARGFLAGNRQRGRKDATLREQPMTSTGTRSTTATPTTTSRIAWRSVAQRKQVLPIQIALAWILRQPGVTAPIVGVTKARAVRAADRRR